MDRMTCNCGLPYADDDEIERCRCRVCAMWSHYFMGGMTLDEARAEQRELLAAREFTFHPPETRDHGP